MKPVKIATLLLAASVTLLACAESAPDQATPTALDNGTETPDPGSGNTTNAANEDPVAKKHKPSVDPRRGSMGDGVEVVLRPEDEPDPVDPDPTDPTVEPEPPKVKEELKPIDGEMGDGKSIDLTPPVEAPSRARRRMNIDQLDAALRRVTGGIGWTTGAGWTGKAAGSNNFVNLSLTLGKPNYTDLTNEDLDPGALFQKFVGDAASSVCKKLVARDAAEKDATKRMLMRHVSTTDTSGSNPGGVDKNLAELMLRFHGRKLAPQAKQLQQWRFLFTSATKVSKSPTMGWQAVCVALIQHPRFYTY